MPALLAALVGLRVSGTGYQASYFHARTQTWV